MGTALADRLRDATRDLHRQVERAGMMPALLRGELRAADYCRLLRNLRELYSALESALLRSASAPGMSAVADAAPFRTRALEVDLHVLHGAGWESLPLAAATVEYLERLRSVERDDPARLVAHAYVRYLGDLNGGQVVRRVVAAALRLEDETGLNFYALGNPADITQLAARFRDALNDSAFEAHADAIVDEAERSFRLHARLFEDLARAPGAPVSRPA